jgi:hypothetical protein
MDDMNSAMESVRVGISLFSDAIGLVNKTKDALPDSPDKQIIEKSLIEAEKAVGLAEAQIAQALGYTLCQCTFPPQIMLSTGYTVRNYHQIEGFECFNCGKSSVPPPDPNVPTARVR